MPAEPIGDPRTANPQEYLDDFTDANEWFESANGLMANASILWGEATVTIESVVELSNKEESISDEQRTLASRGGWCMDSALLLAGLALENALKGILISQNPETTEISVKMDGEGNLISARISSIGGSDPTHDLPTLAREAGLFEIENNPAVEDPTEFSRFERILKQLTHSIQWGSRYPVPLEYRRLKNWTEVTGTENVDPITAIGFYSNVFETAAELVDHITPQDLPDLNDDIEVHGSETATEGS